MYRKLAIVILAGLAVTACQKSPSASNEFNEAAAMNDSVEPANATAPADNATAADMNASTHNMAAASNAAAPAGK